MGEQERNTGQHFGNVSGGIIFGSGAKVSGGVHQHSGAGEAGPAVAEALEALATAIRENREAFEHPDDALDGFEDVREELRSSEPRPGRLRTLLSGIAAMAPGVGAVADAVLKVKAAVGL